VVFREKLCLVKLHTADFVVLHELQYLRSFGNNWPPTILRYGTDHIENRRKLREEKQQWGGHRQQGDAMSLLLFFQNEENRLRSLERPVCYAADVFASDCTHSPWGFVEVKRLPNFLKAAALDVIQVSPRYEAYLWCDSIKENNLHVQKCRNSMSRQRVQGNLFLALSVVSHPTSVSSVVSLRTWVWVCVCTNITSVLCFG
jgi:hypothetical protein